MSKIKRYNSFNEARTIRNKGGNNKRGLFQHDSSWKDTMPHSVNTDKTGLRMNFSERFEYILNKIALKNNAIAKELIELPTKTEALFMYSYIEIENEDSVSYLNFTDKNIPEDDRYKTTKRQRSKLYKVIKTIFGSKYTKVDVNKFVSMYRTVYKQGPDKADMPKESQTNEQLVDKIIRDTKSNKINWIKEASITDMDNYKASYKLTDKKHINFEFLRFFNKYEKASMIIIVLTNEQNKGKSSNRTHLNTLMYEDIKEFLSMFSEKYEKKTP
jgi:hypothetical protein